VGRYISEDENRSFDKTPRVNYKIHKTDLDINQRQIHLSENRSLISIILLIQYNTE